MPNFLTATIIDHQRPANQFHRLYLRSLTQNFLFKAGQYISIKVAPVRVNKYSLASKPGSEEFELIVDCTPGQIGSQFIEKLQPGDQIEFLGPMGIFTLNPGDLSKEILFIATGSGIAPLKSMIEDLLINQHETRKMTLYFGLRYPEDVFLDTFFKQLCVQFNNFNFNLSLSRPDQSWSGLRGRVTDHLEKLSLSNYSSAYICGSGSLIFDTENLLLSKGVPQDHIYYEKFFD